MYKVCIPAAGTGSRLGTLTRSLNKSLVTVDQRPAISIILEKIPVHIPIVILLGHGRAILKEFLEITYPDRFFEFVEVNIYEGNGSGLGYSLLCGKTHLQCPFVFWACDTLIGNAYLPEPNENWAGVSLVKNPGDYRGVRIFNEKIVDFLEKKDSLESSPYIGLSGIKDYQEFWSAMEGGGTTALSEGEVFGLRFLKDIRPYFFTDWLDTGNINSFIKKNSMLDKEGEKIWFIDNEVIKFSKDEKFIANRVKRASLLSPYVPAIKRQSTHFYVYKYCEGKVLSEVITVPLFKKLLTVLSDFWCPEKSPNFSERCFNFYRNKTFERISNFFKLHDFPDSEECVNGIRLPSLFNLLDSIDWNNISSGIPCRYHGDLHFENLLYNEEKDLFTFLDWRQDFDGDLCGGDLYYEFAKLKHGMIVNHEIIRNNGFRVIRKSSVVDFDFFRKNILCECEREFSKFLSEKNYDVRKVDILTGLVFLNIAPLHPPPYSLLLFYLGKYSLFEILSHEPG